MPPRRTTERPSAVLDHITESLRPLAIAMDSISPDPANVRLHPERNMEVIRGSLRRFKQQRPILIDSRGVIIAGNGTYSAAKDLGWTQIAAIRSDLVGPEAVAYAVVDNRSGELATWDMDELPRTIDSLDPALRAAAGFSQTEIDALHAAAADEIAGAVDVEATVEHMFQIVVQCRDEDDQQRVYERLERDGYKCKVQTL